MTGVFDDDPEVLARVGWSVCSEPGDPAAVAVVDALGAEAAWQWLHQAADQDSASAARRLMSRVRARHGQHPPPARPSGALSADHDRAVRVLTRALERWTPRWGTDPHAVLTAAARIGAVPLIPGRPGWPQRLSDLGPAAPLCLWVRGDRRLDVLTGRAVALVGARAATGYGEHVADELAGDLVQAGVTVLSGGAYGIDAAAHRGALAAGARGLTVALLAGGPDRLSPAGNTDLLCRVIDEGGAVVAESAPGRAPSRSRFLLRNRLIAALTGVTVVVEAGRRSGALNTAGHAGELMRPVGAVPGPVTSPVSAGCHHLLRSGAAVCVTDAAQVLELLSPVDAFSDAPRPDRGAARDQIARAPAHTGIARTGLAPAPDSGATDGAGPATLAVAPTAWTGSADRAGHPHSRGARVVDALGFHPAGVRTVAARAGLAIADVEAELGLLELAGTVRRTKAGRWSLSGGTPSRR